MGGRQRAVVKEKLPKAQCGKVISLSLPCWSTSPLQMTDGTKKIVVDREDITQMEAAASQGDKEDSTQAGMEVKEDKEVTTQDRMEAMEVKEVTTQEVMATKEGK